MAVYKNKKMNKSRKLIGAGVGVLLAGAVLGGQVAAEALTGEAGEEALTEVAKEAAQEAISEALTEATTTDLGGELSGEKTDQETPAGKESDETSTGSDIPMKDESVYVIADAAGAVQKVIVSDWIKNAAKADTLEDVSTLEEIENLKGDETFEETDDNGLAWAAGGNDIYYQGTSTQELPVTISVTYYLDGEEMSPEEIAGKSGEVTIRYDFENHMEQEVELNGEKVSLHVPFAVVTGWLLDVDNLKDAQITNGKILTDGDHTIAVGLTLPGMADDLETEAYASLTGLMKADVPDYVEITGQAENFEWNTGYTIVTNELFTAAEGEAESVIDDLFGKLSALTAGVVKLSGGATELDDGAGELKSGAASLADGLGTLTENNDALKEGAKQIFDGVLNTVQDELAASGVNLEELTMDNYDVTLGMLAKFAQGESKEKLEEAIEKLDGIREYYEGVVAYTDGVAQAKDGADQLKEGTKSLKAGTGKLKMGILVLQASLPDLSGVPDVLKQTAALGESYKSFSGLADGMDGKVRFIWKLGGI